MSEVTGQTAERQYVEPAREQGARRALVTWGPVVAVSVLIFVLSSRPGIGQPNQVEDFLTALFGDAAWLTRFQGAIDTLDSASSYVAHLTVFALLALAALWAVRRQWPDYGHAYLVAFVYAAGYAFSDELHQYFVPGRHCDWRDVVTDFVGAAAALAVVWVWKHGTPIREY